MIIGSTIDPGLMVNDYSGFARAGAIKGQAVAQLGKDIGGAISSSANLYQKGQEMKGQTEAFSKSMDSLAKAFPDQAEFYQQASQSVNDPNANIFQQHARMTGYQDSMKNLYLMQNADLRRKAESMKESQQATPNQGIPGLITGNPPSAYYPSQSPDIYAGDSYSNNSNQVK